jgi:hypothetical protein
MTDLPDYHAYLLRLWRTRQADRSVWRASLEDPHTGERRGFASLAQLVDYLQHTLEEQPEHEEARS